MQASGQGHAVVVGGGFGGLAAARALAQSGRPVTVIDRHNYHLFQPLLYQVATAGLEVENIASSLRGVLSGQANIDVRCAEVTAVDLAGGSVLAGGKVIPYDWLVLAPGSASSSFGIPGVAEHAFALKGLPDAVALRSHILACFERAAADPGLLDEGVLTVVVVGGGPTGVELSGALVELFGHVLAKDFPHLDVSRAEVVLLEAADHLLGAFSPPTRRLALETLRARGVTVRLGQQVDRIVDGAVHLGDGSRVRAGTVVWVAGVRPVSLPTVGPPLPLVQGGRVAVGSDLRVEGQDRVFAIGDLAAGWPQLAPVAMQQARHAARQIARLEAGRATRSFHYRDKGTMATIGRGAAVAELPLGVHMAGFVAWVLWLFLHLLTLVGFRNRAAVLLNWSWNYLTYDRGPRLILDFGDDRPATGRDQPPGAAQNQV